ncbi:MAG TPA: 4-hydroxy-tetrahydrodipicolinate reductase [Candidatus Binatia bacterium]|nr:4-hydroxy-tetrahydrodipicolinate reductase [Candidatus Binatia bacterium]
MSTTRIAIVGASGRMGRAIIQSALASPSMQVAAAVDRWDAPDLGGDIASLVGSRSVGVALAHDLGSAIGTFDVAIDFSSPEATLSALEVCAKHGKGMVIGTTGFSGPQLERIRAAAKDIPICQSANFSIGVNVVLGLLEQAARCLSEYDVEIVEAHHRQKVDAPSGTALQMGEVIAKAVHRSLRDVAVYGREGTTGPRDGKTIGFATIRAGDIVGEHTVIFAGESERVEITHRASSRMNFAAGALRAATWVRERAPGLYSMTDVLAE